MSRKSAFAALAGVWLVVVLLVRIGLQDPAAPAATPPAAPRPAAPLAQPAVAREPGFIGVILVGETVDVEPRVDGRVDQILVEPGDQVKRGTLLARLDVAAHQDELTAARAAWVEASQRWRRRRRLGRGGAFTAEEMDGHRREMVQARAHMDRLARAVADGEVVAPFDGAVAERYLAPGALAAPGKPLLRLVGGGAPRIRFAIPEEKAREVVVDAPVTLVIQPGGPTLRGRVTAVAANVDDASRLVLASATPEGAPEQALANGRMVRVFVAPPAAAQPR